jgi:NTP pyrophosphatase (non-canonical NTP hydrolase)
MFDFIKKIFTFKNYIENVKRTENRDFESIKSRINDHTIRLQHGAYGVSTEAGEILDMLKKHIYYGKPIDYTNIEEEIGDALYYCALMLDEIDVSFEDVMDKNIKKLAARYPEKFSKEKAINRDLIVERKILEKNHNLERASVYTSKNVDYEITADTRINLEGENE